MARKSRETKIPGETPAGQATPVSVADGIAREIEAEQPPVSEHVAGQAPGGQPGSSADADGFDPRIHATDAAGNPLRTKTGAYRRRAGRKPGTGGAPNASGEVRSADPHEIAARGATAAFVTLGVIVGGEEWLPRRDAQTGLDEREMLTVAFRDYFQEVGIEELPPQVGLALAITAYTAPRLGMPKTRTRLSRFFGWIRDRWRAWRTR